MRTAVILITTIGLASNLAFADDENKNGIYQKVYENTRDIKKNENDIDDLDSRVETNTNNIQQLNTQIQNLPTGGGGGTNNDAQVQANTTAITNLNTQVQSNTTAINGLTTQTQNNANAIGANSVLIQANTNNLNTLGTQIQTNTTGLTSITPQVTGNTSAINALTIDLNALQASLDALVADVGANSAELGSLNTQIQSNATTITSNTSRIEVLEAGSGGGITPPPPSEATIDFTPYVSNVTTKVFQIESIANAPCTLMRQDITLVAGTSGADNLTITESLTNGVLDCSSLKYDYVQTATDLNLVSLEDVTAGTTASLDMPGTIMTSTMEMGKSIGFAATNISNPGEMIIYTNTLLGVESVSVPFGAYDNCIKIHSKVTSNFIPKTEQVSWHCLGVGEVKRIQMDSGINTMRVFNLTDAL